MTIIDTRMDVIEKWMLSVIASGGINRYDDLHVDQIDESWRARSTWLEAGIQSYELAVQARDAHKLNVGVAVAFSLESGDEPLGANFRTKEDLERQFDWSPPSLYCFESGKEPWGKSALAHGVALSNRYAVESIDCRCMFGVSLQGSCYYIEFRQTSGEYSRTVFVTR